MIPSIKKRTKKKQLSAATIFLLGGLVATLHYSKHTDTHTPAQIVLEDTSNNIHCHRTTTTPQKIFFDVGANRGDVLRIFLESGRQPEDSNNRQWKFGLDGYDPKEWRIIALEASPRMTQALRKLKNEYSEYDIELLNPMAAWYSDGDTIPLGVDDTTEEQIGWLAGVKHGEWGSSFFKNVTDTVVSVLTLDLSRLVKEKVCKGDVAYAKFNVEGAEFPVIRHMMEKGTLCLLNHLDIYWHSHLMPEEEQSRWKQEFIPLVKSYIKLVCPDTQIHVWGVH